jgi:hypothetical protein
MEAIRSSETSVNWDFRGFLQSFHEISRIESRLDHHNFLPNL